MREIAPERLDSMFKAREAIGEVLRPLGDDDLHVVGELFMAICRMRLFDPMQVVQAMVEAEISAKHELERTNEAASQN